MTETLIEAIYAHREAADLTEEALLGELHPLDVGQPWMGKGTYEMYYTIGARTCPLSILEIGVRFGYSLYCMCKGSYYINKIYGFDNEYDLEGSLEVARTRLRDWEGSLHLFKIDTQRAHSLPVDGTVDLAHIDGWHTEDGVYHDCQLVKPHLKKGSFLLIDDVGDNDAVKAGADRFLAEHGLTPGYIDCHHGMYLVEWRG